MSVKIEMRGHQQEKKGEIFSLEYN